MSGTSTIETLTAIRPLRANGNGTCHEKRAKRGQGGLFKRPGSRFWWFALGYRGRLIRQSTGETDIKKAREVLKAKRDEFAAARRGYTTVVTPEVERVTVAQRLDWLVKDYEGRGVRSIRQVHSHLKPIKDFFGSMRVVDLTEEDMDAYIAKRKQAEATHASVNRGTQLLGQAIRPFMEKHRRPVPTIRHLPENNIREDFYERAEFETVVRHLPEYLKDFTTWAFLTAWRRGEIASLKWEFIDREARTIRLSWRKSKNKQARVMALEGELWAIITRQWERREYRTRDGRTGLSPFVFHQGDGRPVGDIRKAWASALKAAGLNGKLFHGLRRTGIRNMIRAGVDPKVARDVSGHKTASVFERYDITSDEDIRQAMLKTQAYVESLPTERTVLPLRKAEERP